ncbi:MAG: helix-turn-helix domain-containing protein [Ruminococcus sp.]|nr:helix-turn-helix domain-containing protein [Ruminococcus sp.]
MLTDGQKKLLIADRVSGMSMRKLAEKYGTSTSSVQRILQTNPDAIKAAAEKKEQNTKDMLDFLDEKKQSAQEFVLLALEAIKDPVKLQKASVNSIAIAMGIVIDKFVPVTPKKEDEGVKVIVDV